MARYSYICPYCTYTYEDARSMFAPEPVINCEVCNHKMKRDYSVDRFNTGSKKYTKPLISHSMAMHPEQIAEHRQLHPEVEVTKDGCPIFNNTKEHDNYLKKMKWEKRPSKRMRRPKKLPC